MRLRSSHSSYVLVVVSCVGPFVAWKQVNVWADHNFWGGGDGGREEPCCCFGIPRKLGTKVGGWRCMRGWLLRGGLVNWVWWVRQNPDKAERGKDRTWKKRPQQSRAKVTMDEKWQVVHHPNSLLRLGKKGVCNFKTFCQCFVPWDKVAGICILPLPLPPPEPHLKMKSEWALYEAGSVTHRLSAHQPMLRCWRWEEEEEEKAVTYLVGCCVPKKGREKSSSYSYFTSINDAVAYVLSHALRQKSNVCFESSFPGKKKLVLHPLTRPDPLCPRLSCQKLAPKRERVRFCASDVTARQSSPIVQMPDQTYPLSRQQTSDIFQA